MQQLLCPSLCFPKWQCKQNSFKMAFYWQVKKIATFYFIVCAHRNMSIKRSVRYEMWGKEYRGQVFDPRGLPTRQWENWKKDWASFVGLKQYMIEIEISIVSNFQYNFIWWILSKIHLFKLVEMSQHMLTMGKSCYKIGKSKFFKYKHDNKRQTI